MQITLHKIKVRDLIDGYVNNQQNGVIGYHGRLDIRPKYQREFVYKDKQKEAVIETISKGFPLNVMYWVPIDPCELSKDGKVMSKGEGGMPSDECDMQLGGRRYEVLDGQQRTISICEYPQPGGFSIMWGGYRRGFGNLSPAQKQQFLDYELMVYICEGTDEEKLEWFKVINIAGEKLEEQEIRNAVYSGTWVTEAKSYFSKTGCLAKVVSDGYVSKKWIRQEGLQTAIKWIAAKQGISIEEYMRIHQHDIDCKELWDYFNEVVDWAKATFPVKRKQLTSVDWGDMYLQYGQSPLPATPADLEKEVKKLMMDGEVQNLPGIYWYVLSRNLQDLNLRTFDDKTRTAVYTSQNGECNICHKKFNISEMEADHIIPWINGGLTEIANCQMLCKKCNRRKSSNQNIANPIISNAQGMSPAGTSPAVAPASSVEGETAEATDNMPNNE
ncbi:MAG: DUF262 domain-containing protein [Bacteroidales bacterium]|nr:DUF262 domain-containing protein [Bacteroidales bacterium]